MKSLFLTLVFLLSASAFAQRCGCEADSLEEDEVFMTCDTTSFDNGALLYWNYDCDSSWLNFQYQSNTISIFSLGTELRDYAGRLGYYYFVEYDSFFMAHYATISGCCAPDIYFLHNKYTGEVSKAYSEAIFMSSERNFPYMVSFNLFKDSAAKDYSSLLLTNFITSQQVIVPLTGHDIEKAMRNNEVLYDEELFTDAVHNEQSITLSYYPKKSSGKKHPKQKNILIDLKALGFK
jgi:hypothetical protein